MSNFISNMINRHLGQTNTVLPRKRGRFEPARLENDGQFPLPSLSEIPKTPISEIDEQTSVKNAVNQKTHHQVDDSPNILKKNHTIPQAFDKKSSPNAEVLKTKLSPHKIEIQQSKMTTNQQNAIEKQKTKTSSPIISNESFIQPLKTIRPPFQTKKTDHNPFLKKEEKDNIVKEKAHKISPIVKADHSQHFKKNQTNPPQLPILKETFVAQESPFSTVESNHLEAENTSIFKKNTTNLFSVQQNIQQKNTAPTIKIHIGRIEVKAIQAKTNVPKKERPKPKTPKMTLEQFLKE